MAQKINLAVLNKKKEEIEKKEMVEVRGGHRCAQCGLILNNEMSTFRESEMAEF